MSLIRVSVPFLAVLLSTSAFADDFVPQPGKFPPQGVGTYLVGELISVDHVNRRGAIRLLGDSGNSTNYDMGPSHRFAMLPYGTIRYHGAPAELRDIPIGTVLHGDFVLPPKGDHSVPPPAEHIAERLPENFIRKQTHALTLEDTFSFCQRQGRAWKVIAFDGFKLKVSPVGELGKDGLLGDQTFDFDFSTRVWKGRQFAEQQDIAIDQVVQLNLTWAPDWQYGQCHLSDVWIDEESRSVATERQRRIHVRYQRYRWLPGWVDHVEHQPKGKGIVTVTLFGGMDPSLYDAVKAQATPNGIVALAAAEPTLRTWRQDQDRKRGPVLELKPIPDPPPGSSGLQLRVHLDEILEGFRPGRIVKIYPNGFPSLLLPPEERMKDLDDLRSANGGPSD